MVQVLGYEVEALADTEAAMSIINSRDLIDQLGLKVHNINLKIKTVDGTAHQCLGGVQMPYTYGNVTKVVPTVIVVGISQPLILGMSFLDQFGFELRSPYDPQPLNSDSTEGTVNTIDLFFAENYFENSLESIVFQLVPNEMLEQEVTQKSTVEYENDPSLELPTLDFPQNSFNHPDEIITEHNLSSSQRLELFEAVKTLPCTQDGHLGKTDLIKHSIEILPEAHLRRKQPMYKYSPTVEREVDSEIERMKKLGVIEECSGPVDFLNPT